jgi:GT2 family glycosyltransferase
MKDVAISIINYNTSKYTIACIGSILEHTVAGLSFDIIVIDNNSEPDDFAYLQNNIQIHDTITLHRSPINRGFGGGHMESLPYVNATYFLCLNNDSIFLNDCLIYLKEYLDTHPTFGLATAQNFDEAGNFSPSFHHYKTFWKLLLGKKLLEKINPVKFPKRKKEYTQPLKITSPNGAFLFFRGSTFAEIGGFDTNIFLYSEEMDFAKKLEKIKTEAALVPQAKFQHFQGKSSKASKAISKEAMLSELYVIKKHYSFVHYKAVQLYFIFTLPFKPKKWFLFPVILRGDALKHSLKQKQKVRFLNILKKLHE